MTSGSAGVTGRPIALVGFMAVGKSKIGRLLAKRLALPFKDTDEEIEAACGKSIAAIFRDDGEAEFRRVERNVISRLIQDAPHVMAAGGGAFMDAATREALQARATTIWLDPPFGVIAARLKRSSARPLASSKNEAELLQLWHQRRLLYATAQLRIETSDDDPALAVERIVAALASR